MWGSTTAPPSTTSSHEVLVDYRAVDYRGFLFVVHDIHGLMLLRCTRKKSKGPHWQVPGGHVDEAEFLDAAKSFKDRSSQLRQACKAGAARELFEETGIDLRSSLDRIIPASLRSTDEVVKRREVLLNELKNRLFFFVSVNDSDFPPTGVVPTGREGTHLRLKISAEHSGFCFQPEPREAAEMLKMHSGGKVTEALLMAMARDASSTSPPQRVGKNATEPDVANVATTTTTTTTPLSKGESNVASDDDDTPSTRRRRKRDKEAVADVPADLFPKPEKKGMFCCFC